jgi:methylated-DNA-[protein]-cysteine S-methyltransferase
MVTGIVWESLATPVGTLSVACSTAGAARVRFGPAPAVTAAGPAAAAAPAEPAAARALAGDAARQLAEYFAGGRRGFGLPVDWSAVAGTRRRVLSVLADSVGYGQVVTYGELASRAGVTGDGQLPPARVVGQVMAANPFPVIVPCHRVVAGGGALGGYSGGAGAEVKRWLLIFEGSLPATLDWDPAGLAAPPPG